MLAARSGKGGGVPVPEAFVHPRTGELRHQIKFARPEECRAWYSADSSEGMSCNGMDIEAGRARRRQVAAHPGEKAGGRTWDR